VQFFKEIYGTLNGESVRINPGEIDKQGVVKTLYTYYDPEANKNISSKDELVALYQGYEKNSNYKIKYNTNKENGKEEKIRTITEKNSNRFNLLQTLAETFECWIKFDVLHKENGEVLTVNGVPQKFVSFKEKIGEETGLGFVYGIDLKQI
jgi:hypothetical protein